VKLAWASEAVTDRRAIYDHVEAHNPNAALKLDSRFEQQATLLTSHPGLGRPGRVPGTRELVVQANYVIVYAASSTEIHVLRVLHAARKWP
jgi:addiction module RelE/StbE family toxin